MSYKQGRLRRREVDSRLSVPAYTPMLDLCIVFCTTFNSQCVKACVTSHPHRERKFTVCFCRVSIVISRYQDHFTHCHKMAQILNVISAPEIFHVRPYCVRRRVSMESLRVHVLVSLRNTANVISECYSFIKIIV